MAALSKATLEVMKQEIIVEAQDHCNALMKKNVICAKIPLVVIKALVSGSWYNESEGQGKC